MREFHDSWCVIDFNSKDSDWCRLKIVPNIKRLHLIEILFDIQVESKNDIESRLHLTFREMETLAQHPGDVNVFITSIVVFQS